MLSVGEAEETSPSPPSSNGTSRTLYSNGYDRNEVLERIHSSELERFRDYEDGWDGLETDLGESRKD